MTITAEIPKEMKAIRYHKLRDWSLVTTPVPEPKAHEVLIKGMVHMTQGRNLGS